MEFLTEVWHCLKKLEIIPLNKLMTMKQDEARIAWYFWLRHELKESVRRLQSAPSISFSLKSGLSLSSSLFSLLRRTDGAWNTSWFHKDKEAIWDLREFDGEGQSQ